jgi:hypothetical protein
MVFNATFNNISVSSLPSVLLVEETGVHGENHRPAASQWKLNNIMLYHTGIYTDYNKAYNILRVPDIFLLQTNVLTLEKLEHLIINLIIHTMIYDALLLRFCLFHDTSCVITYALCN